MMRFLTTLVFLAAAGGVFFAFTTNHYDTVRELQAEQKELTAASEKMRELNEMRSDLLSRYNAFSQEDLERLEKALPDNVDNVKLVRDIDGIAARYDMTVRNIMIQLGGETPGIISSGDKTYGSLTLSFAVSGPYKTFVNFLRDLERSLRIVDVIDVSFNAEEKDLYEYTVTLRTYWLK
ncbi:MAG: type 4a pilus biogenesis protein PilO [Candidatus Yonathbacteria bacterium]|nr:type 4a pilus biogenesis protein PilO [Candidatus Yonathbacteria bacterium]NTW47461.1 type 4a pilus biogenesis protein PilO [Candidatus Yonathbacteria bacterium]